MVPLVPWSNWHETSGSTVQDRNNRCFMHQNIKENIIWWSNISRSFKVYWLVVWWPSIWHFPINIGFLSSSQLTKSYFSEGFFPRPTKQIWLKEIRRHIPRVFFSIPNGSAATPNWGVDEMLCRPCPMEDLGSSTYPKKVTNNSNLGSYPSS